MESCARDPAVELVGDDAHSWPKNLGMGTNPLLQIAPLSQASLGKGNGASEVRPAEVSGEDHLASHGSMVAESCAGGALAGRPRLEGVVDRRRSGRPLIREAPNQ